jgi:hypothetical protein
MVQDTWTARDLPVLEAIVELADEGSSQIRPNQIVDRTGLSSDLVMRALFALADDDPPHFTYVDGSSMGRRHIIAVKSPTGKARRAVGSWPTPEIMADRLIDALNQAAENEPDEARKGRLRQAASYIGSFGRDLLVEVMGSVISQGAV